MHILALRHFPARKLALWMAFVFNLAPMPRLLFLLLVSTFFPALSHSQSQSILQIQSLLLGNTSTTISTNLYTQDFCKSESKPPLFLYCYQGNITQLHVNGNLTNQAPLILPESVSPILFDAVSGLTTLKVLSLVSLGLSGSLPESLARLKSLEILNVSCNQLKGPIPPQLSTLKHLQTLVLDHNSFTGQVPAWIGSLRVLSHLSMKNNSFSGLLPRSITKLLNLRILALSGNSLSGDVPDLRNLTNLQVLDLENNSFGPHFPGVDKNLVYLSLRNNSFRFAIPAIASTYYQLRKLDISSNRFVGPFNPSMLSLPSVRYLDVSENRLTGNLFQNMSCGSELTYVNLSSNLLTGELPSCLKHAKLTSKKIVYMGNCLSDKEQKQHPHSFCQTAALAVDVSPTDEPNSKKSYAKPVIATSMVGGIALVGLIYVVAKHRETFSKNCRNHKHGVKASSIRSIVEKVPPINTAKLLTDARCISQMMKMGTNLPAYKQFTPEEVKEATRNFDASSLMHENQNCRTCRGSLRDGTTVVVKSLKTRKRRNHQNYTNLIEISSRLRHRHLVSTIGHCLESCPGDSNATIIHLILEFVPNGNLRSFVSESGGETFNWMQRIGAAIGVAKGVQFLHSGMTLGLFFTSLKISDILLDQNFQVKISGYNFTFLAENKSKGSAGVRASHKKSSSQESDWNESADDIFNIGVIFLEIITGRPIRSNGDITISREILQASIEVDGTSRRNVADPRIAKECSDESLATFMEICLRCIADDPGRRPSIEDVLWKLEFAFQTQDQSRGYYTQETP